MIQAGATPKTTPVDEREQESKTQHGQRRSRIDGDEIRAPEGDQQNRTHPGKGHRQPGEAPEQRQENAFGDDLTNQPAAWRAQGHANGRLKARGGAARQQQVRNVGASDQQHQAGNDHQQVKTFRAVVLEVGDPAFGGRNHDVLLVDPRAVLGREVRLGAQPVLELCGDLRLNARRIGPGLQSANDEEPVHSRAVQQCGLPIVGRLGGQGQPEIRRIGTQLISEESGRGNSNDGEGEIVDVQGGADDRGIEPEMLLPCTVAHHRNRRGVGLVIVGRDGPAREGAEAEHREVVAGDELSDVRFGGARSPGAAHVQVLQAPLKGGHLAELGIVIAELLVQRIRVDSPVVLKSAEHAAIAVVAQSVKLARFRHRQALEHHGVEQSEDRGVGADAQRERDHADCREAGRLPHAAQTIAKIL